jgi:CheY-like chemotaxis protein
MINDVLQLSRLEMVGFTLDKEPTQLGSLLGDTLEIVEDLFRERPIRLELEITGDLPTLDVDRTRIRQVLLNLLNNAARFTEQGIVQVEAKRVGSEVQVSVSDTGPGIPEDELPRIFDEFYQVDRSLSRKQGGTGLGLAICRHFVKSHEGRIWAESEVGKGSTFFFALPIPGQYVPASGPPPERSVEHRWPESPPPILVVDPDPTVAELVSRHIQGYEVVNVTEPEHLEEGVTLHHPHAIVCNVPPGGHSNLSLSSAPVPFIECSLPSHAWLADEQTVAGYLTKPITTDQILGEIERLDGIQNVLIVDDDRGFCQLMERTLTASGHTFVVRQAYAGEDGLQAMRAARPDLLLLDLIMPDMDGFQVLEEMRREPGLANVPVLLLTAVSLADDMLTRRSQKIVVRRPDGLNLTEVLRCLQSVIDVLEPRYDERSMPLEAVEG